LPLDTAAAPKEEAIVPPAPKLKDTRERSYTWPDNAAQFELPLLELTGMVAGPDTGQRRMFRRLPDGGLQVLTPPPFNVSVGPGKTSFLVTLTSKPAAGKYQLVVPFTFGEGGSDSISVDLELR